MVLPPEATAPPILSKLKLTLFDLDHTLLPFDSDHAWGDFITALGWTDPVTYKQRNDAFYADYQAGRLDIHDYVRFSTEAIRRQGPAASEMARAQFMQTRVVPDLRPQALQLVREHQAAGDAVVIVTATNEFITRPIADAFGVEDLIAVELARDARACLTGAIRGVPSFRAGKIERVAQWLAQHQLDWDQVETTFYSDSMNDLPLLERVDHPVATNPDERLHSLAQTRGWRILELFPT
jgi:HAD superfamily hydrolase (TIGR01490 family)